MQPFFERNIEFLKGVGPQWAELLNKELGIFKYADLLQYYPFRYEDRTKFYKVNQERDDQPFIQNVCKFISFSSVEDGRKQRLVGVFGDWAYDFHLPVFPSVWIHARHALHAWPEVVRLPRESRCA